MDNSNEVLQEILSKITNLENKYLNTKKEIKDIKERLQKLEKTHIIF
jgi:regulator of replication initiation timing